MSAYDKVSKGSLKIKGATPIKKKKKPKSKSIKDSHKRIDLDDEEELNQGHKKTDAENKFEQHKRKKREKDIKKTAKISYKDRVLMLNKRLEELSEHHDIPKVGPG